EMAAQSAAPLAQALRTLLEARDAAPGPRKKIHLLAHSMGNRVLLRGLFELFKDRPHSDKDKPFGQVILAAPDVGASLFNNLVDGGIQKWEQLSYYFCRRDTALAVSQNLNKYEPVGLYPYFQKGLITIDADNADTSFFAHAYYAGSVEVLSDIQILLERGAR